MQNKSFTTISHSEIQSYVRAGRQLQAEAVANSFRKLKTTLLRK